MKKKTRSDYFWPLWMAVYAATVEGLAGMKRLYPKTLKKYKSPRVINPCGIHVMRVHPRQGIKIVQSPLPTLDTRICDKAKLELKIKSDYLFIEKTDVNKKGQVIYNIAQKYDLTNWAEVSEIFLGEIHLEVTGNTHPEGNDAKYNGAIIPVYHCPSEGANADILTVVNPQNWTVRLEPHRMLEVVVFEPSWPENCGEIWKNSTEDFEVESEGIFLNPVHKYDFLTKIYGQDKSQVGEFVVLPRYLPVVNRHLNDRDRAIAAGELDCRCRPGREFHFWYNFAASSRKKAAAMKNGNYMCSRVSMHGSAVINGHKRAVREFFVMLSKHGKPTSNKMFSRITAALRMSEPSDPLKRVLNMRQCLLQNPGNSETLEFSSTAGYQDCTVEIPYPCHIWKEEPEDALWDVSHDTVVHADKFITIQNLAPSMRGEIKFQRFRIDRNRTTTEPLPPNGFLGAVKVLYSPKRNFPEASKRLAVWLEKTTPVKKTTYSHGAYHCPTAPGTHHWKSELGYYREGALKLAEVSISEIDSKSLADNAYTIKLCNVPRYSSSGYDNFYYGTPVKKNALSSTSMPPENIMGHPTVYRTAGLPGAGRSGNNRSSLITGDITTQISTNTEPIVVYNPVHQQEITLGVGQELHIRLSSPDETLTKQEEREQVYGELWTPTTLPVSDIKPIIFFNGINSVGTERYKQEVRIKVDATRVPEAAGTHQAGCIKLECSVISRVIRLYVKKDTTEKPYKATEINVLKSEQLGFHEANKRLYVLANSWKHNDGIELKPSEVLYVKNPPTPPEYGDQWSVQFVQHPIPHEIWDKLPSALKSRIDRNRPWYTKDVPVHMRGHMVFKQLEECSTYLPDLIKAMKPIVRIGYLPILTMSYTNFKTGVEMDGQGLVEKREKLQRDLHICLKLGVPEAPKKKFLWHPVDKAEYHYNRGDEIVVNVTDPKPKQRWAIEEHPPALRVISTAYNEENTSFRLDAKNLGVGWLRLRSGDKKYDLYIMVA